MFFKMSLGMLALAGLALAAPAAVPGTVKQLHGHVPSVVSHLTPTGRPDATNRLHLAIGLPLHNPEGLSNLLRQIYDPASQNYHQFLTPAQFTEQFGPTPADYQAVQDFARSNGLAVTHVHGNRMLVGVEGQVSDVERAFNITLRTYRHPTENRTFFAPDTEPSVPVKLSILDVSGLSSYSRPHSFRKPKSLTAKTAAGTPLAGSAPDGTSYMGYDYRKAYVPGTALTGAGQKIALVQFDGYFPGDIAAYQQLTGLPTIPITNILLDGFDGNPTLTGGEGEVELDIEMVNSWAPGLSQLLVYEENPNVFNQVVVLNQIAMDNAAKQVSCSWGWFGGPNGTINQILQQMILQGQSFFQASGDSDAMLPGQVDDPNQEFSICADAYVTSVGGTKLATDAGGNYTSEMVWNDRTPNPTAGDWGSGGGISSYYPTPAWQAGFGTTTNHGIANGRNFPDVALPAEDVYVVLDGLAQTSGGTSAAAPAWAGFMALVNQQAALSGKLPVGFVNPSIYAIAQTAAYNSCFHDVTNGDNTWSGSLTNFFAVPGYDLCTGLGTPNGTNLINALVSLASTTPPVVSAPLRPWGGTLSVMDGSNPNGAWFLFVQDDITPAAGIINSGWYVTLTTAYPVGNPADNQLYLTSTITNTTPGNFWPVTLAVTNYGPSSATNVFVAATLPLPFSGVSLVSSNPAPGTSVAVDGGSLTWTIGNLPINNGASLTLNFYAAANGLYTNSATVSATTSDPNPDDDTGTVTLLVSTAPSTPPQLNLSFQSGSSSLQLSVTNSPGQTVVVQESTNLVSWIPILTNTIPFTNSFATTNFPAMFYRAVVGP
jgi:subtilase family serine protease